MSYGWFDKHAWLSACVALLCGLGNAYEAIYMRPDSLMSIIDWVFAVVSFLAFLGLSLNGISNHLSKSDD
jgi:hypothetical protein